MVTEEEQGNVLNGKAMEFLQYLLKVERVKYLMAKNGIKYSIFGKHRGGMGSAGLTVDVKDGLMLSLTPKLVYVYLDGECIGETEFTSNDKDMIKNVLDITGKHHEGSELTRLIEIYVYGTNLRNTEGFEDMKYN